VFPPPSRTVLGWSRAAGVACPSSLVRDPWGTRGQGSPTSKPRPRAHAKYASFSIVARRNSVATPISSVIAATSRRRPAGHREAARAGEPADRRRQQRDPDGDPRQGGPWDREHPVEVGVPAVALHGDEHPPECDTAGDAERGAEVGTRVVGAMRPRSSVLRSRSAATAGGSTMSYWTPGRSTASWHAVLMACSSWSRRINSPGPGRRREPPGAQCALRRPGPLPGNRRRGGSRGGRGGRRHGREPGRT